MQDPIDAEFEVITPAREEPVDTRRWWQGWYLDWRHGLVGALIGGVTALASVLRGG